MMKTRRFLGLTFILSAFILMAFAPKAQDDSKKGVYVENDVFDFGTISREGDSIEAIFVIKNATDKPVSLATVNVSCGCTTSSFDKAPIATGKSSQIKVMFNPKGQFGTINKRITAVLENGDRIIMTIKGIVE
jgi:Protein of unknown function (DUF1573).